MASKRGSTAEKGGGATKAAGRPKGSRTKGTSVVKRPAGASKGAARTVETAEHYRAIYADWVRGWSWHALAKKHQLSERRCQEVIEDLRRSNLDMLRVGEPMMGLRFADDLILRRTEAVSEAAEIASRAKDQDNLALALGGLRRRDHALSELTGLLQALGYLPDNLAGVRWQGDAIEMGEKALQVFQDHDVAEEVQDAFIRALGYETQPDDDGRLALQLPARNHPGGVAGGPEDASV